MADTTALRNKILQLAIEGKLVEQRAEEGDARTLLDEIKAEKAQLIAEKKIKKDKPLAPINDSEIPFDIPNSWVWVRLGEVGFSNTGSTPPKNILKYFGNYIPFLSPKEIKNNHIQNYDRQGLSKAGCEVARPVPKNTIIQVCIGSSIGKCAIVDREVTFNQQINSIETVLCHYKYIYWILSSNFFVSRLRMLTGGSATPIVNKTTWENYPIPLPPLGEQKRIVEKLDEVMAEIDKL